MRRICSIWGLPYSEHFAGMTLMRPYSSTKLLTKKVEKQGIFNLLFRYRENAIVNEVKNERTNEADY
jgi:hypothetical protein